MRVPRKPSPSSGSRPNGQRLPPQSRTDNEEPSAQDTAGGINEPVLGSPFQSPFKVSIEGPKNEGLERDESDTEESMSEPADTESTLKAKKAKKAQHPSPSSDQMSRTSGSLITASGLHNATPRPSLSPEPSTVADSDDGSSDSSTTSSYPSRPTETSDLPDIGHVRLDNDAVAYDIKQEPLPNEPFFNQSFQSALKSATVLARHVRETLGECALARDSTSDLSKLLNTAKRHEDSDSPESRTIGIIGDSASGKSSLINSLLHVQNLARKGDFGQAITSFVTEYRRRTPLHSAPFTIEVEYGNQTEIYEQLHELLFTYQELWSPDVARLAESEEQEETNEFFAIENRSGAALATLRSIFPDAQDVNPENLKDRSAGAFARILGRLKTLAKGLRWPDGARDGRWTATAVDAEGCQEQVDIFMENGLWPLTNVVRIYLSAQVLKTGVILADLPGFRDINLARVRKTQQYLARCDEIFVVANVKRAAADKSVRDTIRSLLRSNAEKQKGIAVICTHADDIDLLSAEKEKHWSVLAKSPDTKKAKKACDIAYKKGSAEYELAQIRYNQIFASARNQHIAAQPSNEYPQLRSGSHSNIFCVGKRDYEGYQYRSNKAKMLAIQGSGIPTLRRFCHSIIAKAQYMVANHFLSVEVPAFVQSLEVWLDASKQVALPTISLACVGDSRKKFEANIQKCRKVIEVDLENRVLDPLTGASGDCLGENAIIVSRSWKGSQNHWSQYKAWARNNGDWCTNKSAEKNWNAEPLYEMNKTLPQRWHELGKALEIQLSTFRKALHLDFEALRRKMRAANVPQALLQAVDFKERDLGFAVNQEAERFVAKLGNTVRYNSIGTHISSFTLTVMVPAYREISAQCGTWMMARMHSVMETEMQRRRLFPYIRERTQTEMLHGFDGTVYSLLGHVAEMFSSLEEQMGTYRRAEMSGPNSNPEDLERVRRAAAVANVALRDVEKLAGEARGRARELRYL